MNSFWRKSSIPSSKILFSVLLFGMVFLCACQEENPHAFQYVEPLDEEMPLAHAIHGIDISHHNGTLPWKQLKSLNLDEDRPLRFVFIKATEGRSLVDPMFQKNWKTAARLGFVRGAYHFYIPTRNPKQQAQWFCSHLSLKDGDLPPVLDFEMTNGRSVRALREDLKVFCSEVEKRLGIAPIIYTNKKLFRLFFQDSEAFDSHRFWMANYDNQAYDPGEQTAFWQYSKKGKIQGHATPLDLNVFLGEEADFNALLYQEKNVSID